MTSPNGWTRWATSTSSSSAQASAPADYDPDDPDQRESAEWMTVVASFRGDRESELRRALQEMLNGLGLPSCNAFWSPTERSEVVRGSGLVISTIGDLFAAEGCDTREDLDEQVDDNAAGNGRIDWSQTDASAVTVRIDERSETVAFPFTTGAFWATVVRLDETRAGATSPSKVCRPHWRHADVCRSEGLPCSCGCVAGTRWCVEDDECPACNHPFRYHLDASCRWDEACGCSAVGRTLRSPDGYLSELDESAMRDTSHL